MPDERMGVLSHEHCRIHLLNVKNTVPIVWSRRPRVMLGSHRVLDLFIDEDLRISSKAAVARLTSKATREYAPLTRQAAMGACISSAKFEERPSEC